MAGVCAPSEPAEIDGFARFGAIPLQGVFNCRDLGGLPADGGRRIRRRRLIRSASLGDATAEDIKQLMLMHDLERVIDLRAEAEVQRAPDPLPLLVGVDYANLPALSGKAIGLSGLKGLASDMRTLREFAEDPYDVVEGIYPKCLLCEPGMSSYNQLLNGLIADTRMGDGRVGVGGDASSGGAFAQSAGTRRPWGATLWHCSQGKDRTGIAAILVEWALGVPVELIRRDYLASNLFIRPWIDRMRNLLRDNAVLGGIAVDLEAYSYSSECYFNRVFEVVEGRYGSMGSYMDAALNFGTEKRALLRELYLE